MLSKFEQDGQLNPTFQTGPFELPLERVSGGVPGLGLVVLGAPSHPACPLTQPVP